MKKMLVATLIIVVCLYSAFSQENPAIIQFEKYLNPELKHQLAANGEASSMFREKGTPKLFPKVFSEDRILREIRDMNVTFGVEICKIRQYDKPADTQAKLLSIYNILLSVRSLKGILYFSASRNIMREFIHESYRINGPNDRTPLPDSPVSKIVSTKTMYTYQQDSSFGENTYQVTYRHRDGYFLMEMVNLTQVWYGIIPIVDPGKLRYYIMVIPEGNSILFYSMICVSGANPFGIMEGKAASFFNRIKALERWFQSQYKD